MSSWCEQQNVLAVIQMVRSALWMQPGVAFATLQRTFRPLWLQEHIYNNKKLSKASRKPAALLLVVTEHPGLYVDMCAVL
jgi:predicted CoA-binding protein